MKKFIFGSLLIVFIIIGSFTLKIYKSKNDNNSMSKKEEQEVLKKSKYTPDEMLGFFKGEANPNDLEAYYDIILNWYDYYSKDTLFINKLGEVYSYDEYMKIRKEYGDYAIKTSLPVVQKDFYLPVLTKD